MLKRLLTISAIIASACGREMSDPQYRAFSSKCYEELTAKQKTLTNRTGGYKHFDWNQDTGQLAFTSPGKPTLVADVQFVGDISKSSGTWLWAWDNPTIDEKLKVGVRRVREFGRAQHISRLTRAKWPADQSDGWELTAVAAHVLNAEAGYRTEARNSYVFMTLTNLREAPAGFSVSHSGDQQ